MRLPPLLVALALLAPAAVGQVPLGGPRVELTWTWAPAEPVLRQGSVLDLRAQVHVAVADAVCAEAGELRVALALAPRGEASGLATDPAPLAFALAVPQGAHGVAAVAPFEADVEVPFELLASTFATPGGQFLAGVPEVAVPEGCLPASTDPAASAAPAEAGFAVYVLEANVPTAEHPDHEGHGAGGFDAFLAPGASATKQFNATGTFPYHDHFRPELKGRVVVEREGPAQAEVQVTSQGFNPAEARIGQGGTVRWTNADSVAHTVSADEMHPEHLEAAEAAEGAEPEAEDLAPAAEDAGAAEGPARATPGPAAPLLALLLVGAALALRRRP